MGRVNIYLVRIPNKQKSSRKLRIEVVTLDCLMFEVSTLSHENRKFTMTTSSTSIELISAFVKKGNWIHLSKPEGSTIPWGFSGQCLPKGCNYREIFMFAELPPGQYTSFKMHFTEGVVNGTQFGNVRPCDSFLDRTRNIIYFGLSKRCEHFLKKVFEPVVR